MSESFTNTKRRRVKDPSRKFKLRTLLILLSVALMIFACFTMIRALSDGAESGQQNTEADAGSLISETSLEEQFRQAYLRANGGLEYLQTLKTLRFETEIVTDKGVTSMFVLKRRPDMLLMTREIDRQQITIGHASGQFWVRRTQANGQVEVTDLSEEEAKSLRRSIPMFGPILSVYLDDSGLIESMTEAIYKGQKVLELKIMPEFHAHALKVLVDSENMTILAQSVVKPDGTEEWYEFSDYRTVQKVKIPHKIQVLESGDVISSITIKSVAFNVGATSYLFQR